jgi:probable F420-dependent oxidoreductase
MEVKSGIFLPTFWSDYGSRTISQAMLEIAGAADALGFDSVWACDHIVSPERNAGSARCLEPMILMATLAQQFPQLTVGTDVLVLPQRNAVLVAKQAATLSVLTGGRFILGIGAGWNEEEFRMANADFERRGEHTDEAISLMKLLWKQTPVSFTGSFYNLENAYFYPDPVGDGPPVWVGGASQPALTRAARYGDGWMPFWGKWKDFEKDLEKFRGQVRWLRSQPRGQEVRLIANVAVRIVTGSDEHKTDEPQSVEKILETVRKYQEAGVETIIWNIQSDDVDDYLNQLRLIAEQVVPMIRNG